jgi:hypothetical protein
MRLLREETMAGIRMNPLVRKTRLGLALVVAAIAPASPALAQARPSIAGDFECTYGCRLTDAAPSIAISGSDATCMNEFGGVYHGRLLSGGSLSCFNKTGKLKSDGQTIQWDDGVIWKRRPEPARP